MSTTAPTLDKKDKKVDFKRILMATDFSAASRRALDYALAFARRFGSEISVVNAIPPEPRESVPMDPLPRELNRDRVEAEREMGRLSEEVRIKDLRYHTLIQQGSVWDVLSSVIQREGTDLLVLGTRGRGGLKKLALGSVAEEVLRLASCPVLTVGPNAEPPTSDVADLKNILFATDFGPACVKAFPYALSLAEDCRAKLILLHMVPPMPVLDVGPAAYGPPTYVAEDLAEWKARMREEGSRKLKELIPSNAKLAIQPQCVVETSFLPEGILDIAAMHQAELIVMGANRARSARLAAHIPWAVTHDVLCEAKCPVLTVRD
jgi:nucleotide-binding universal stress UspA family protein